uniref:Uncharacterized protein n=1 Tax=Hyaloperonospora arabidopsidis (strain Emoy2) TaxID=559515 RepID=M4BIM2_HYAAE
MAVNVDKTLHEYYLSFVQIISICDDLRKQENSALRAQVHDLTEMLAAFNLCELQDPHLIAVRDRAFQRDITPEVDLLEFFSTERKLLHEVIQSAVEDGDLKEDIASKLHGECRKVSECLEPSSSVADKSDLELECLHQRVELLEREVVILRLRQELLEETTPRIECPSVKIDDDQDIKQEQKERGIPCNKPPNEPTKAGQEQQERIVELEDALTTQLAKNAALRQQSRGYRKVQTILQELS